MTRTGTTLARVLGARAEGLPKDEPILEAKELALRFEGVTAIDGVSFNVQADELFAIVGPNGAGKTSIFNCLSGLYRPQRGSIRFLQNSIVGRAPHEIAAMGMARMFQNVELFEHLTVIDNLMLGRHHHIRYGPLSAMLYAGRARREELSHREVVEEIVDFLEIEPFRREPVGLLPFGIKKRVEFGRALAMEPALLLLDEPVAGMNLEETEDMARFILDAREELHVSIILVEHDMGVVMDIADRVLVLDFGRAIAVDVPDKIQHDPEVMRAYLGEEQAVADTGAKG